jgi:Autotransporter beta-domain
MRFWLSLLALIGSTCFAMADITDGKYSQSQSFNVSRSPGCNTVAGTCTLTGFSAPYIEPYTNGVRVDWAPGDYLQFFYNSRSDGLNIGLKQFDKDGNLKSVVSDYGKIRLLGDDILYVGGPVGKTTGYYVSNTRGIDTTTTQSLDIPKGTFDPTAQQLADYQATKTPLNPGQKSTDVQPPSVDAANTLATLVSSFQRQEKFLSYRLTSIGSVADHDCTQFGESEICLSFFARYSKFASDHEGAGLLILAWRVNDWMRIGLSADYSLARQASQLSISDEKPRLGIFSVIGRDTGLGSQVKLSASIAQDSLTIQRNTYLEKTEAGRGKADLRSHSIGIDVGYGIAIGDGARATPFMALQSLHVRRHAYSEGANILFPFSYGAVNAHSLVLRSGTRLLAPLTERLQGSLSLAADYDLAFKFDAFTASSQLTGAETVKLSTSGVHNRLRPNLATGLIYNVTKDQSLTASVSLQGTSLARDPVISTMIGYSLAF